MTQFRWMALLLLATIGVACTHSSQVEDREPATTEKDWSNFVKAHCEDVFEKSIVAKKSSAIRDATSACTKAIDASCDHAAKKALGGAEGLLAKANCFRLAAYGSNKSVHEGRATSQCEDANKRATKSKLSADYEDATLVCKTGVEDACESRDVRKSHDALANVRCYLTAARFGSLEVNGGNCPALKTCSEKCNPKDENFQDCTKDCESTYDPNVTCGKRTASN